MVKKIGIFSFFQESRREREKRIEIQQMREYRQELKSTPHAEMFDALRNEGGLLSLLELYQSNQLSHEIKQIYLDTLNEMLRLSLSLEKLRYLTDVSHMYLVLHKQYERFDLRLRTFLEVLSGLNSVNSFVVVNPIGTLVFLNPLNEPVNTSNDHTIQQKINAFLNTLFR